MSTLATPISEVTAYPVRVDVVPALSGRNRLTAAFRIILALPHLLLVGGPIAGVVTWASAPSRSQYEGGFGGGALGAVAAVATIIAWFAILFTGVYPKGLRELIIYYLRWRVRAIAYTTLLRDEYPPFGEGDYPVTLEIRSPKTSRDRLTVAFRLILSIPHLVVIWALGMTWALTTILAWCWILLTGRYPDGLYQFGVGVLRWTTRLEAYLLLMEDEYPPFFLR